MGQQLSGPGIGLPPARNLYPSNQLYAGAAYDFATNTVCLNAGDTLPIPAGNWYVTIGNNSFLQFLDPVNNTGDASTSVWRLYPGGDRPGIVFVKSDGFNLRLANMTGCPVAAIVQNGGTNYVQATTTATAAGNTGGSTWRPIVGGALSVSAVSLAGANYGKTPIVFISAPPTYVANGYGGVAATAYATLTGTTVSGVTLQDVGAGYTIAPKPVILPDPTDPNFGLITQASVTVGFLAATQLKVTAVLCTNPGAPVAAGAVTVTIGGAGSAAVISPVQIVTVTNASVVAVGAAMGNVANPCGVTSVGGVPTANAGGTVSAIGNAMIELSGFRPRPYTGVGVCNAGGSITSLTTIDSGLFAFTPTPVLQPGATGLTTGTLGASIAFTTGSAQDVVIIQPSP